jgi:hypothetical protein
MVGQEWDPGKIADPGYCDDVADRRVEVVLDRSDNLDGIHLTSSNL